MGDITAVVAGVNQFNVDSQTRNKEATSAQSTTTPSNEEFAQLQQGIAGVISMQAISKLSESAGMTQEAMTKPTFSAQELKKEEQEEQQRREDGDNF